jgi:AcrR family transcriptional regulator
MSPRKPAVLRDGVGQNLREYLIATAARLIGQRGSAGLAVRDIAREAKVADGVLYNYFEDKEDLLAHALLAHVAAVMNAAPRLPPAGTGTVAENLRQFIDHGLAVLVQVTPAFAGVLSQPNVLTRFHAMVGGDAAFGAAAGEDAGQGQAATPSEDAGQGQDGAPSEDDGQGQAATPSQDSAQGQDAASAGGPRGLPAILADYLRAEQRLGRIDASADIDAATMLVIGAIHGQVLPRVMFGPPGSPITAPPGFAAGLAATILGGIGPRAHRG